MDNMLLVYNNEKILQRDNASIPFWMIAINQFFSWQDYGNKSLGKFCKSCEFCHTKILLNCV